MGEKGWPGWVRQWVLPFVEEVGLMPVLVALLGHVVVIVGPLLLAVGRGNVGASLPLTAIVLASFWLCKTEHEDRGSLGLVSATVGGTWVAAVLFAVLCARTGIL